MFLYTPTRIETHLDSTSASVALDVAHLIPLPHLGVGVGDRAVERTPRCRAG